MYSQPDLGRRFRNGKTIGQASNVEIVELEDRTLLVGYGWAVYAERDAETGEITYHGGWYGYSPSTSCQLSRMSLRANADEITDNDPTLRELKA